MESFSEILEEAGVDCSGNESEVGRYLSEPLIDFDIQDIEPDYVCWWAKNKMRFPVLAKLAQLHLSAPPTSGPSERLFSTAGDIYDEKRNRLLLEKAETVLFIKHNFYLVGGCVWSVIPISFILLLQHQLMYYFMVVLFQVQVFNSNKQNVIAAGGQFYPLASETLGYWTPSSLKILKTIASKTTTCNTTSLAQAFENLMQQLSVRLWTFNAHMEHSLLQLHFNDDSLWDLPTK